MAALDELLGMSMLKSRIRTKMPMAVSLTLNLPSVIEVKWVMVFIILLSVRTVPMTLASPSTTQMPPMLWAPLKKEIGRAHV